MCIQKYAHNLNQGPDGKPVKHFFRLPIWWLGMIMNIGGEVGNMFAYGLPPASVVSCSGCVGWLTDAALWTSNFHLIFM